MLYGVWQEDLDARLLKALGGIRREAWGLPDLSSNVFRASVSALAVLYDRPPQVHHDAPGAQGLVTQVRRAGLWSMMQRHQRDTIGLREMLTRVDGVITPSGPALRYRPVYPDMVIAQGDPEQPDHPIRISECRLRRDPTTKRTAWTWDVWDVSDPDHPVFQVRDATSGGEGKDLSEVYLGVRGGLHDDAYPSKYRQADGLPRLPYAMRHAAITGELWDAFEAYELVEGSLNCGVLWTFFGHCVRNASWPQRYAVNVRLPSAGLEGDAPENRRDAVVSDPATVLIFEVAEEGSGQPLLSQWAPGADPEKIQEAVALYERRVAAYAGIAPSDVQRVAGDPRSGFAIALNREAQREAQRRYEPVFRPPDEELLELSAIVMNDLGGTSYPEFGYRVAYQGLPPSPEEQQATRDQNDWDVLNDQASPIDVYIREHPGATESDARDAIVKARIDGLLLEQQFELEAAALGLTPKKAIAPPAPAVPPMPMPPVPPTK